MTAPAPTDRLYELLPVVYRTRDAAQGYPLRDLLRVVNEQVQLVEADIGQLYENWFIETCEDWVVPYIGDLIGYRAVHEAGEPGGDAGASGSRRDRILVPRRDVAHSLRDRRRKGTLALLELLAGDAAGWPARAVEFYRELAYAQAPAHRRLDRGRTADLRSGDELDLLGGPFDRIAHSVDVRRAGSARTPGRFNIPSVGLFVWRLRSYSSGGAPEGGIEPRAVPALCLEQAGPHCFTFSPLGIDTRLYNRPRPEVEPTHIAEELDLPVPIRRRALERSRAAYYGAGASLAAWAPDWPRKDAPQPIPAGAVLVADLTGWRYRPPRNHVAIDPILGRMAFPPGQVPRQGVRVLYHYGFSADMGGGEYRRDIPGLSMYAVSRLHEDDVLDWKGLARALRDTPDEATRYLQRGLPPATQSLLEAYDDAEEPSPELRAALLAGLNELLGDDQLYSPQRFDDAHVPAEARALLAQAPQGERRVRLNRVLLEGAYPAVLALSFRRYRVGVATGEGVVARLNDAIRQWETDRPRHAVIEIQDSEVYVEPVNLTLAERQTLQIQAVSGARPVIQLLDWRTSLPDALSIVGGEGSQVTLDGLLVTGRGVQVYGGSSGPEERKGKHGDLCDLTIRHCTLVPGWALDCDCKPLHPNEASLELINTRTEVRIESSIVGSIEVVADEAAVEPLRISVSGSILDATDDERAAVSGGEGNLAYAELRIARTTVFGGIETHAVRLAENSIFTGPMRVARRQLGCVRFCSVAPGSRTPRRYHCQPDLVEAAIETKLRPVVTADQAGRDAIAAARARERARVRPRFNSTRYGAATYAQLADTCADEITGGAEDEAEMGAFHDLFQPQREANLRARLAEYTPAGSDAGLIHAS